VNLVLTMSGASVGLDRQPLPQMPDDLKPLFEES
jgi:hypothetical protein